MSPRSATLPVDEQLTIDEFLAMLAEQPSGQKWELIEGRAIVQDSPAGIHQTIVNNIGSLLRSEKRRLGATWHPLLGIGTYVPASPRSLPQPDIMVMEQAASKENTTDDAVVLFEVLSPSNTKSDQRWRRKVYSSVPNCLHYVTITQDRIEIVRYDRSSRWQPVEFRALTDVLELPGLGAELPLPEIYWDTPLG